MRLKNNGFATNFVDALLMKIGWVFDLVCGRIVYFPRIVFDSIELQHRKEHYSIRMQVTN